MILLCTLESAYLLSSARISNPYTKEYAAYLICWRTNMVAPRFGFELLILGFRLSHLASSIMHNSPSYSQFCSLASPLTALHSTKFLSFVISSNSSCNSASLILFDRLGIKVFASSALSQHRLPKTQASSLASSTIFESYGEGL